MTRKLLFSIPTFPALALALLVPVATACAADDSKATEGVVKAAGTLTVKGDCRILTDPNGRKTALVGKIDAAQGDQIRVTGKKADKTSCLDGPTIRVDKLEKIKATQQQAGGQGKPEIEIDTTPGGGGDDEGGIRMFKMRGTLNDEVKVKGCQGFRNLRGDLWALTGDLKGFKTGDKVMIEGLGVDGSECGSQTVQVNVIEAFKE